MADNTTLLSYLLAGYVEDRFQEGVMEGVDWAVKQLIKKLPKKFSVFTGIFIGLDIGSTLSNIVYDIDNVMEAAYQFKWAKDTEAAYYATFAAASRAFFGTDTVQHYKEYAEAAVVMSKLLKTEYELYGHYLDAAKVQGDAEYYRNCGDKLLQAIDDYYYAVLAPLGVEYVELFN